MSGEYYLAAEETGLKILAIFADPECEKRVRFLPKRYSACSVINNECLDLINSYYTKSRTEENDFLGNLLNYYAKPSKRRVKDIINDYIVCLFENCKKLNGPAEIYDFMRVRLLLNITFIVHHFIKQNCTELFLVLNDKIILARETFIFDNLDAFVLTDETNMERQKLIVLENFWKNLFSEKEDMITLLFLHVDCHKDLKDINPLIFIDDIETCKSSIDKNTFLCDQQEYKFFDDIESSIIYEIKYAKLVKKYANLYNNGNKELFFNLMNFRFEHCSYDHIDKKHTIMIKYKRFIICSSTGYCLQSAENSNDKKFVKFFDNEDSIKKLITLALCYKFMEVKVS